MQEQSPLDNRPKFEWRVRAARELGTWHFWFAAVAVAVALLVGGFQTGRHQAAADRKAVWLSDIFEMNGGARKYAIDVDLKCPGGQDLGKVQADLNLATGKLRIVRNDPGEHPVCPPAPAAAPLPFKNPTVDPPRALPQGGAYKPKAKQ